MNALRYPIALILISFALGACGVKAKLPQITIASGQEDIVTTDPITIPETPTPTSTPISGVLSVSAQKVEPLGTLYDGGTIGISISAKLDTLAFAKLRLKGGTQSFLSGTVLRRIVTGAGYFAETFIVEALDQNNTVVATGTSNVVFYTVAPAPSGATPPAPLVPNPALSVPCAPPPVVVPVYIGYSAYQSRVIYLYWYLLGRAPEPYGLSHWTNLLYSGVPDHEIVVGIAASDEFYRNAGTNDAFVKALYRKLLHREGEPAGLASWLSALNAGTLSRIEVTRGFVFSAEYRGI